MSYYGCCDYCGCYGYWDDDKGEASGDWLDVDDGSLFVSSELYHGW